MNVLREARIFAALLLGLGLAATSAMAANPHFIGDAKAKLDNDANLVVSWKEAGVGNNELIDYLASADASGFYACINKGGNHPQASNKEEFSGPVSAEGSFNSGKNGQITASLTVSPPPATLDCPAGQQLVFACVRYSNIALADTTNGVFATVTPSSLSAVLYQIEECDGF